MSVPGIAAYVQEEFSADEAEVLRRYVTNVDGPVFALVNLPEVVKGALFARYSRTHKSLRRLFLDEFVGDLDVEGDAAIDATVGVERAERLYERAFLEYGDDSVAQLGGVHLACEQASNLLTKILERGRLMSYLEQSTRYIAYDDRLGGRYRYYRDPELLASPLGTRYVGDMDRLFDAYAELVPVVQEWCRGRYPKQAGDSDFVHRRATRAKALDAVRGVLPAASLSNVGIYGSGQGYEALLLRMRAHPLPEARAYADLMLGELRKVIPSFLTRVDLPDRGGAWSQYLAATRQDTAELAAKLFADAAPPPPCPEVTLVDFDPDGEEKVLAAMLYPHVDLTEDRIIERVRELSAGERSALVAAYVGDRTNRRHKPGRALERISYRFDVCTDYGAFRDLQRHRMLTIEWQPLTPRHGYALPEAVAEAGAAGRFNEAMERSAGLYEALNERDRERSSYAVCLAYRVRFSMQVNAREALHMLELRTAPQGHPAYRAVCQQMHRLIADQAGHRAVAELMRFVDHCGPGLERLDAERRAEQRRAGQRRASDQQTDPDLGE
ncbi:MAG: FAD-dependent thymidylate synthase [Acidimicrobiales bacterium]